MLSGVAGVSGGILTGASGFSSTKRVEKVFTYATRSARSCGVRGNQRGIADVSTPLPTVSNKSLSSGMLPDGVDRHLKRPIVKSRGFGFK